MTCPNDIAGAKATKNMNMVELIHCKFRASLKSEKYSGARCLISLIRPPNGLPVRSHGRPMPVVGSVSDLDSGSVVSKMSSPGF